MTRWHLLFGLGFLSLLIACQPTVTGDNSTAETESTGAIAASDTAAELDASQSVAEPDPPPSLADNPAAATDTTVIPGDRVGPVTAETSRADLAAQFGEAALQDTEVAVGEGFTESGTIVNAGSDQAFAVIWVDASQSEPDTIKDFGPAWETPEGIRVGTSFAELQAILGSFDLYGFGWDYGGTLVLEDSDLSNYYGSLILRLQPADPATPERQAAAFAAVQGDRRFASDDPNLAALDLVVGEMIVYINPPVE